MKHFRCQMLTFIRGSAFQWIPMVRDGEWSGRRRKFLGMEYFPKLFQGRYLIGSVRYLTERNKAKLNSYQVFKVPQGANFVY